jgi:hypothetical protein
MIVHHRKSNIQAMRDHVNVLAASHEIAVETQNVVRLHESYALREADGAADEINVAPIRSTLSYAVALHEIGHIVGRYQDSPNVLTRERWAWKWARAHAIIWTKAMERYAVAALAWYETTIPDAADNSPLPALSKKIL